VYLHLGCLNWFQGQILNISGNYSKAVGEGGVPMVAGSPSENYADTTDVPDVAWEDTVTWWGPLSSDCLLKAYQCGLVSMGWLHLPV